MRNLDDTIPALFHTLENEELEQIIETAREKIFNTPGGDKTAGIRLHYARMRLEERAV